MLIWLKRGSCPESMVPTHKLLLSVLASIDAPKYKHCHNPGHYEIFSIDVTHSNVFPLSLIFWDRVVKQMHFKLCTQGWVVWEYDQQPFDGSLNLFPFPRPNYHLCWWSWQWRQDQGLCLSRSFHNAPHTLLLDSEWKQTKSTVSCISSKSIFYLIIILLATVF